MSLGHLSGPVLCSGYLIYNLKIDIIVEILKEFFNNSDVDVFLNYQLVNGRIFFFDESS